MTGESGRVVSVSLDGGHHFSKQAVEVIHLLAGLGVAGDAHAGLTVKHRSRVRQDPSQPNLRQVHLIHAELLDELNAQGFTVNPADLGENILTRGLDLLALPRGTHLTLASGALIEVTGLRNPCSQIEGFQAGLLRAVLEKLPDGTLVRKAGVMGVVVSGGEVRPGDTVHVQWPPEPHVPLQPV